MVSDVGGTGEWGYPCQNIDFEKGTRLYYLSMRWGCLSEVTDRQPPPPWYKLLVRLARAGS